MIASRQDYIEFCMQDNSFAKKDKNRMKYMRRIHDSESCINKYLKYLRKQEYYLNTAGGNKFKSLLGLFYERKKHNLGNKLGFYIGPNCFDKGLSIYHHGTIIVNPSAKIGKNCKMHGNNCIGNNGTEDKNPVIGDNVDIGFGAVVIGNITIADDIKIGANAVVNKSFTESGIIIAGVPAKKINKD